MNIIWANRLIAGTKTWAEMPASRRAGVKKVLAERVAEGEIVVPHVGNVFHLPAG